MSDCSACLLRCLRVGFGDTISIQRTLGHGRLLPASTPNIAFRKRLSTASARRRDGSRSEYALRLGRQRAKAGVVFDHPPREEKKSFHNTSGKKSEAPAVATREEKGTSIAAQAKKKDNKHLQLELKYLGDPLKLAEHVRYTLRSQKPEKALELCRLASKKAQVVVSWNHCVDWHMTRGKIDDAIKIYNEMKKRAQFPDSYTYVLLLRGLARSSHRGNPVSQSNVVKAVSIYNSMSSPNSRVKPTIFHTNAVLRVCSMALDMDALWGIAGKLPTSGPSAPDHVTYCILLTAIRHGAFGQDPENVLVEHVATRRNQAVREGRRIWQDIIPKWRSGEVHIDEELVCSMGRLLLLSNQIQDWDDVLNLVHQTMNIPRQIQPLGHADRKVEHIPIDHDNRTPDPTPEDSDGYTDAPSTKAFNALTLPTESDKAPGLSSVAYVQPSSATLSLLIEACTVLRTPKTAQLYWDLLTSQAETGYNVTPDLDNFHAQLKLLGKNRASTKAALLVRDSMSAANVEPKNQTFRIAMSVCVRDKNNPNALTNAQMIVDVMESTTAEVDIHTLMQYLNLALSTDSGSKIVEVLDRLDPIVHNLRSLALYGRVDGTELVGQHAREKEDILQLLQTMAEVMDTLMSRNLVRGEDFKQWIGRSRQLKGFVIRNTDRRGRKGNADLVDETKDEEADDTTEVEPFEERDGRGRWKMLRGNEQHSTNLKPDYMTKAQFALKNFKRRGRDRPKEDAYRSGLTRREVRARGTGDGRGDGRASGPFRVGKADKEIIPGSKVNAVGWKRLPEVRDSWMEAGA